MTRLKHEESPTTERMVVCVGLEMYESATKLLPVFVLVVDGAIDEAKPMAWAGLKAAPGVMYKVNCTRWDDEVKSILIPKSGRLEYVDAWSNAADRARWSATARSKEAVCNREKARVAAEKTDELAKLIEPLSAIYRRLGPTNRAAFLLLVQEQIVRPSKT